MAFDLEVGFQGMTSFHPLSSLGLCAEHRWVYSKQLALGSILEGYGGFGLGKRQREGLQRGNRGAKLQGGAYRVCLGNYLVGAKPCGRQEKDCFKVGGDHSGTLQRG